MAIIVAMLKEHEWVRMRDIIGRLAATEFERGAYLGCGNRTVQRDIKVLQDEYSAPIEYSKREAAYTLHHKEWLCPKEVLHLHEHRYRIPFWDLPTA